MWQDFVISGSSLLLVPPLLMMIGEKLGFKYQFFSFKVGAWITSICLLVMAFAMHTLGLAFSSIVTFTSGILWMLLAVLHTFENVFINE